MKTRLSTFAVALFAAAFYAIAFAADGPSLANPPPTPAAPAALETVTKERDDAKAELAKLQSQAQELNQAATYYLNMRNAATGSLQDAQQNLSAAQQQIAQLNATISDLRKQLDEAKKPASPPPVPTPAQTTPAAGKK